MGVDAGTAVVGLAHIPKKLLARSATLPQVRTGNIKAYAVAGKARLAKAPEIPTAEEAGVSGLAVSFWHGLWAPKVTIRGDVILVGDLVAKATTELYTALFRCLTRAVAAVQAPVLGGIRCRLDQLDVVLRLVDLVEIGRARIR